MREKLSFLISLGLCLMLAIPGYAKKPVKEDKTFPVIVTFRDCDNGEDPEGTDCLGDIPVMADRDDGIQSDGLPYVDGEGEVAAHLGNFRFSVNLGDGNRQFLLNFSQCASGPCTPPSPTVETDPNGSQAAVLFSVRHTKDIPPPEEIPVGDTVSGYAFLVVFIAPGQDDVWRVEFNPSREGCEGTDLVNINRADENTWVFKAGSGDIGCLLRRNRGKPKWEPRGLYFMPFEATVERKP